MGRPQLSPQSCIARWQGSGDSIDGWRARGWPVLPWPAGSAAGRDKHVEAAVERFGVKARAGQRPARLAPCTAALQENLMDSFYERKSDDVKCIGFGPRDAYVFTWIAPKGNNLRIATIGSPRERPVRESVS